MTDEQRVKIDLLRERFGNGLVKALQHKREALERLDGFTPRLERVVDALYSDCEHQV